jgi:predicted nucleic acid-binding protein
LNYLLDTCVLSEARRKAPNVGLLNWLDTVPESRTFLSVLVVGEVRKGIAKLGPDPRAHALLQWLEEELTPRFADRLLSVDTEIALIWGRLSGESEAGGNPRPVVDSILAATALRHNLTLVTRNVMDFAAYPVQLFDPWESSAE